jgi:sugar lactone lactonase YvrE
MNFFSPARPFTSTLFLMLILIPGALLAQTTATIVGRITDPSGAAVVSGTVTVQNVQTGGAVFQYDPVGGAFSRAVQTRTTGALTLQRDGSLLLFQDGRIAELDSAGRLREVAAGICPENERFNDAIADPEGRVFAGVMGGNGKLVRFDMAVMMDGVGIPNGMGFTPDLAGMYFTDSVRRRIYYFDYDRNTGDLANRRVFAEVPIEQGVPDGMAVDSEGFVWTAIWFGSRVKRYAPDGRLDREIPLPVTQTSAVAFGGSELADLYVTSAAFGSGDSLLPPGYDVSAPRGGDLYCIRNTGVRGTVPFRSAIRFS